MTSNSPTLKLAQELTMSDSDSTSSTNMFATGRGSFITTTVVQNCTKFEPSSSWRSNRQVPVFIGGAGPTAVVRDASKTSSASTSATGKFDFNNWVNH